MRCSQLLESVGEQCRRHPIMDQERRSIIISLPFEALRQSLPPAIAAPASRSDRAG